MLTQPEMIDTAVAALARATGAAPDEVNRHGNDTCYVPLKDSEFLRATPVAGVQIKLDERICRCFLAGLPPIANAGRARPFLLERLAGAPGMSVKIASPTDGMTHLEAYFDVPFSDSVYRDGLPIELIFEQITRAVGAVAPVASLILMVNLLDSGFCNDAAEAIAAQALRPYVGDNDDDDTGE